MSFIWPVEMLSWPRLLFVRVFAKKQLVEQRRQALRMFDESLHSAFLSVVSAVQQGIPAYDRLQVLVFMLEHIDRSLSPKKRFLMGSRNLKRAQAAAALRYARKLEAIVASLNPHECPSTRFVSLMNNMVNAAGGPNEDATKGA